MLNLKKTALAVIALGSTAAFAGTMGPVCSAVNVTVPCETCAWDFGGRALYLQSATFQPSAEASYYANGTAGSYGVNPQWGWGFQLEASYHYGTGNDMNLNWYHYSHNANNTRNLSSVNGAFVEVLPDLNYATGTLATSVKPQWDQVNLEFAQHVDFGENKFVRLHGGINYSRVGGNGSLSGQNYATTTTGTQSTTTFNTTSVYNGFGPRVGADLNYEWGNGIGVYATGAVSVLAGTSKASIGLVSNDPAFVTTGGLGNLQNSGFATSRSNVIPELDAKLGAMYTYAMAQGDLSLDVGWVWAHYVNALTSEDVSVTGTTAANLNVSHFTRLSSFGIQGLYFGAKWVGNVA